MTGITPIRERIRRCLPADGQALVETALTIPFLMLILVGGVELGRVAYAAIEVANAAKAAAQYGAQTPFTAQDNPGMTLAAQNDAANLRGLSLNSSLALACSDGSTPQYPYGSQNVNLDCPGADAVIVLSVTVHANVNTLLHFPGIPSTITLYGQARQDVLGD